MLDCDPSQKLLIDPDHKIRPNRDFRDMISFSLSLSLSLSFRL